MALVVPVTTDFFSAQDAGQNLALYMLHARHSITVYLHTKVINWKKLVVDVFGSSFFPKDLAKGGVSSRRRVHTNMSTSSLS